MDKFKTTDVPMTINHRRLTGWGLPPQKEKRDLYKAAIDDVIFKLHLTDYQADLLSYYASCGQGFAPAFATIEKETGITKRQALRTRNELEKIGLVATENKILHICWDRIMALAAADEKYLKASGEQHFAVGNRKPTEDEVDAALDSLKTKDMEYLEWLNSLSPQEQKEQIDILIEENRKKLIVNIAQNIKPQYGY